MTYMDEVYPVRHWLTQETQKVRLSKKIHAWKIDAYPSSFVVTN